MEKESVDYFSMLKASLEEALAFERGDESKCRVSIRKLPAPSKKTDVMARKRVRNV